MTTVAQNVVPVAKAHKNTVVANKTKKVKRRQKDHHNRKIRKNVVRDLEQNDDLALYQRTFQLLKDVYGVEELEWVENTKKQGNTACRRLFWIVYVTNILIYTGGG